MENELKIILKHINKLIIIYRIFNNLSLNLYFIFQHDFLIFCNGHKLSYIPKNIFDVEVNGIHIYID